MPIQPMNFANIPAQGNSIAKSIMSGVQTGLTFPQDLRAKQIANQINQVKAQYAQPMAEQDLQKAILYNKYYGPETQSVIGLNNANAGLAGSQAATNRFKLNHPEYLDLTAYYYDQQLKGGQQPTNVGQNNYSGSAFPSAPPQTQDASTLSTQPQAAPKANLAYGNQPSEPMYGQYGVPLQGLPQSATDPIANKLFGNSPLGQAAVDTYKEQVNKNAQDYRDTITSSVQEANSANNMQQALAVFNNAMDNSTFKGSGWKGNIPSSHSMETAILSPFHDFSNEQLADNAVAQMLPSAMSTLRDAMGSARFSNLDLQAAAKLKFDRGMNDDTRKNQAKWINAVSDRMKEKPQFYGMLGNPASGAQKFQADLLWQAYQNQFPLISPDGKSVLRGNLGKWPLFASQAAIESVRKNGSYEAPILMKNKDGVLIPIKKDKVKEAEKRGYKRI